jgi:hypothetical protein
MPKARLDDILERMHALQAELEGEIERLIAEKRQLFHFTVERGKVRFEDAMKALQKRHRVGVWAYLKSARISHVLTAPVIYGIAPAFVVLDIAVSLYQYICFPVYGIPRVRRSDYIVFDRHYLSYLNAIEKFNCLYCAYGNGLLEYLREVTARTEQYWCPIKHAMRTPDPHRLADNFVDYGDAESYRARLDELRKDLASLEKERRRADTE